MSDHWPVVCTLNLVNSYDSNVTCFKHTCSKSRGTEFLGGIKVMLVVTRT